MSLSPEVAFLCSDPDLGAQEFTVRRRKGAWNAGRFTVKGDPQILHPIGNIQSPTPEQLVFFPEGERKQETKVIYTRTMLYMTEGEDIADEITWHDHPYKIIRADRWDDWGFCVAYVARR